jgi:hypothetical protein
MNPQLPANTNSNFGSDDEEEGSVIVIFIAPTPPKNFRYL